MDSRKRILVVDDDPKIVELLRIALEKSGFHVVTACSALEAERLFRATPMNLVVMDLMMPQRDGFALIGDLRAISNVPIIILSARQEVEDIVKGLELGADDYITKPFNVREMIARVNATFSRLDRHRGEPVGGRVKTIGDVSLDLDRQMVKVRGVEIPLSPTEMELLHYMMMHAGRLLERETLLHDVWGYDYYGRTNLVDVAVRRLREKIETDPSQPVYLLTVRGQGYRFATSATGREPVASPN